MIGTSTPKKTTPSRPDLQDDRREQMIAKADANILKLERRLQTTIANLDTVRQYKKARTWVEVEGASSCDLEANLEKDIQGLQRRIKTTTDLLDTLRDGITKVQDVDLTEDESVELIEMLNTSMKNLSLDDTPEPQDEPFTFKEEEKTNLKINKTTCVDAGPPPCGEFATPAKVLMGQVLEELDHKFHKEPVPPVAKPNPFNVDDDDYSTVLEVVDEQIAPLEALDLIEDTHISIRCGLSELCHRVVTMGGGKPEAILDALHKLNLIATQMNENALKKAAASQRS